MQQLKDGKSLIRIGDGEVSIIHYLGSNYQSYSKEVRDDLIKIIADYDEHSRYIIGIGLFVNYANEDLRREEGKLRCWMPLKVTFEQLFNRNMTYVDSHLFYKDGKFKKIILPLLKDKKVIIITNDLNIEKIKKTEFGKGVFGFISCPPENAYESREIIKFKLLELIEKSGHDKDEFVVLMSAGFSKTIIYDLSTVGLRILDIGKGIEGFANNISLQNLI